MRNRLAYAALAAVVLECLSAASCSRQSADRKEEAITPGTLSMALETVSASGKVYRLRQATFAVTPASDFGGFPVPEPIPFPVFDATTGAAGSTTGIGGASFDGGIVFGGFGGEPIDGGAAGGFAGAPLDGGSVGGFAGAPIDGGAVGGFGGSAGTTTFDGGSVGGFAGFPSTGGFVGTGGIIAAGGFGVGGVVSAGGSVGVGGSVSSSTIFLSSESNPDSLVLETFLAPNDYTIQLFDGWFIEQVDNLLGTSAFVPAVLLDSSVQFFGIQSDQETHVNFNFEVDGERISFGDPGRLIVTIGVQETTSTVCGNGIIDPGEMCDAFNLNGETCASVTMNANASGILQCSSVCTFDTSACSFNGGGFDGGGGTDGAGGTGF